MRILYLSRIFRMPAKQASSLKGLSLLFSLFLLLSNLSAKEERMLFRWNSLADSAHSQIIDLRLEAASASLERMKRELPVSFAPYYLENYIDFFRSFISEKKEDYKIFNDRFSDRIEKMHQADDNSPYLRYCLADMYLQLALVKGKHGDNISAALDLNKSYKLLLENEKRFPLFILNKKSLSLIRIMVGSLSGIKKSILVFLTALDGTVMQGLKDIDSLYLRRNELPSFASLEVICIRALLMSEIEGRAMDAHELLKDAVTIKKQAPLLAYVRGIIASQAGYNEAAIKAFDLIQSPGQFPFHYLDLSLGIAKLKRLDNNCDVHLNKFLSEFDGMNYIKEANQKLAWYHLIILNDEAGYEKYMKHCKSDGNTHVGEDEAANEEADSKRRPDKLLLKSRLLFDGGYYLEASKRLDSISTERLDPQDRLEYLYRKARILQKLAKNEEALSIFQQVISYPSGYNSYFACNAALQAGVIEFGEKNWKSSRFYLDKCLNISPKSHKMSLHTKAKIWLSRIEEIN